MPVDLCQEQGHGAAFSDSPSLVQVCLRALGAGAGTGETPPPSAGEEAAGETCRVAGAAA
jgi:hypothetical protein